MKNRSFSDFVRRYKEAAFALVMLVLFSLVIYFTKDIRLLVINTTVTARFWPTVCGIAGCILSGILFVQSVIEGVTLARREESGEIEKPELGEHFFEGDRFRSLATLLLTFLYIAGLKTFGFLLMTVLYLFCVFIMLAEKENRKVWKLLLIDVVFTILVYLLFRYVFKMILPLGTIW